MATSLPNPVNKAIPRLSVKVHAGNNMKSAKVFKNTDIPHKASDKLVIVHTPACIESNGAQFVVLSKEEYDGLQETLYLLSIPGMREKILQGMKEPSKNCTKTLSW